MDGLEAVFTRWSQDETFRERFRASPEQAIREQAIDLSDDEWSMLHGMELEGLADHHLKQRVSKSAFALGRLLGLGVADVSVDLGVEGESLAVSLDGGGVEGAALDTSVERGLESAALAGGSLAARAAEGAGQDGAGLEDGLDLDGPSLDDQLA